MHILMTIDVGNTNINLGLMAENKVIGSFRLTTMTPRTSDEFGICIRSLMDSSNIKAKDVDDVIISSVVPKRMYALTSSIVKYIHKEPIIVGPGIKTGIKIQTDNPREVGADRIVDVAAAHYLKKRSCIIVDFGTATTFDYVDEDGVFKYTVIAPGLGISANALTHSTAKLPEVEIVKPKSILGRNTVSGIQAGVVYGYIGLVEGILKQMKKELKDKDAYVIATGGLGKVIARETRAIDEYDPLIAYEGMRILYDLNRK
jgi:type III pantothenate kinase